MSKPEARQLTTDDLIAIGKAASFLRFEATYKTHATDEARKEWREVADALTDIECRNHPATPISPEAILGDPVCGVTMQKAEDPDEWVVQDRVPVRNCDQWCWKEHGTPEEWEWENGCIGYFMHGQRGYNAILHVRCRRRDLPKVEQPEQCAVLPEKPLQISLGEGRVAITCFSDDTGRGVIFRDTGINHPVGSLTAEPPEASHAPMPGEIYIHCKNKESAIVLIEQMQEVVRQFDAAIEQWPKYYRPVNKATSLVDQKSVAYFRRETRTSGITVHTDGTTFEFNDWEGDLVPIVQITESEAMALLKKPEPRNRDEALAMLVDEGQKLGMYGTPQTAKTRVRLWISAVDGSVYFGESARLRTDCEIHHDAEGFYVEETK